MTRISATEELDRMKDIKATLDRYGQRTRLEIALRMKLDIVPDEEELKSAIIEACENGDDLPEEFQEEWE